MNDEGKHEEFELFLSSRKVFACPTCPIGDKECLRVRDLKTYSCHIKHEIRAGATDPEKDYYYKVMIQHTADRLGICLHTFHGLANVITALQDDGVLTHKDIGVELDGGAPSTIRLMEMIAGKEGFGRILADGYPGLFDAFGDAAGRLASHTKGRHTVFDPRQSSLGTMEFGELTNPRGAHFQSGGSPAYVPGKTLKDFITHADRMGAPTEAVERVEKEGFNPGRYTKYSEDWFSLFSSVGLCNRAFLNRFYSLKLIHGFFSTLTGLPLWAQDLMRAAERGWNLTRVLNLKAGFTGKDDAPPDIWFVPGTGEGTQLEPRDYFGESITREDVDRFLQDYFDERGWDQEGKPSLEKLLDLGLERVAGDV
jgi:aldehyde:ferredoxin oxidoreductase